MPGVESVGLALYSTLEGNNWGEGVRVEGRPEPGPNEHNGSSWDRVSCAASLRQSGSRSSADAALPSRHGNARR